MTEVTASGEHEESKTSEVAPEQLDPLVGQTLDNRFRIVELIGTGAMGKVYRAVQVPLNRAVALKVLDSTYGAGREESFKQRFLVEAALTAKLNHPNTVRVVDYGSTADGLFFLAMEYLDGETLETLLKKGPLPWHRALAIALQMARAHDPALPFVVLSGFVAEDRPADDGARGADAWVCKDDIHEMPAVLRGLLAR